MAIDYKKIVDGLKDSIVGPVTDAAKKLLQDNKDAARFLEDRAKRVAELGGEYLKADDDAGREAVMEQLDVVRQSIQNEISQVAVNASIDARATFKNVLDGAIGVILKVLPVIVAAL
jgi:uncharacterized protein (DUF1786 family)